MVEPGQVLRPLGLEELMRNHPKRGQSYEEFWKEQAAANEMLTRSEINIERLGGWNFVFRLPMNFAYPELAIQDLTDWTISLELNGDWLCPEGHETAFGAPAVYVCLARLEDAHQLLQDSDDAVCARFTELNRTPF